MRIQFSVRKLHPLLGSLTIASKKVRFKEKERLPSLYVFMAFVQYIQRRRKHNYVIRRMTSYPTVLHRVHFTELDKMHPYHLELINFIMVPCERENWTNAIKTIVFKSLLD